MSANVARHSSYYPYPDGLGGQWNDHAPDFGSSSHLTQQYALPIHRLDLRRTNSEGSYRSGEETPRAEYTLRRKTPNGTLNAGYDGSVDLNPNKHQVLPLNEGNAPGFVSHPTDTVKRTFTQHQQRQNRGFPAPWADSMGIGWQQPQANVPVMNSMLQQMPIHEYQQYYGATVPSVIQPPFQYLGPTASGTHNTGQYGPYWHDGTFVPYRPAAVRDPRYYHHPTAHWSAAPGPPHVGPQPNTWQHSGVSHPMWAQAQGMQLYGNPTPPNMHQSQIAAPTHAFGQNGEASSGQYRYDAASYARLPPQTQYSGVNVPHTPVHGHPHPIQTVDDELGPASPKGRQRDRTFAWALAQYRQLLAYIHQARRHQQQSRHAQGQPSVQQRPSFYPRPPNLSRSSSTLKIAKRRTDTGRPQRQHVGGAADASGLDDNLLTGDSMSSDSELEAARPRGSSLWSPSGLQFHDNEYSRRASNEQYNRPQRTWQDPLPHRMDKFQTIRRSKGSSVSAIVSPVPTDDSPPSRAMLALEHLTELCKETEWQWTDGMHLGGCLAYGLGDYKKARRWYEQVLETDSKHLEATSNLAATLLALGQRREAEQHWMHVVKAAPNHFEAVEHLIGMLCTEQRSRDAIRVIEYVERSLRQTKGSESHRLAERASECSSTASRSPCISEQSDRMSYDFESEGDGISLEVREMTGSNEPGFGSSGFAIPGSDNGRILALNHAKGNMLYGLGDNAGAARAFEDAVLIAAGRKYNGIQGLVKHIMSVVSPNAPDYRGQGQGFRAPQSSEPILLSPEKALATSKLCFPDFGELPGLQHVPGGPQSLARKAVISTTSNSLLSLAKIFQDGMSNSSRAAGITPLTSGVRDILALYYLSLSLQPSPSTANNVGILLASVQQAAPATQVQQPQKLDIPGVVPGSGIALALQYYNYGLQLDQHHAHLYTNLGSLLKDIGQLDAAINMYERAVKCDGKFDIALANLANAVKDKGRINDAIAYYKRAVEVSPEFAEAVCGLANALNSVCAWHARGGIAEDNGKRDRWHVDQGGMLLDARQPGASSSGWIKRVVDIVGKQLVDGETWGSGTVTPYILEDMVQQFTLLEGRVEDFKGREAYIRDTLTKWAGKKWEGARITRMIERVTRRIGWHWYNDMYIKKKLRPGGSYNRPQLPATLTVPTAPTVLPFHTFTCPMSAKQIRLISQRNGLRISVSTFRSPWLPKQVYPPPAPPTPYLKVGYVSSDFNNHPLAHLMQSVFGLHDASRAKAYCYATTASDNSVHRRQIQAEAPVFHDASGWSAEKLINQIVRDGIHILVNLNGYTRGARNEVFAARPAPIQMSFMGFAGTLGAEWCDYLLADKMAIPPSTLRPWRRNVDIDDQLRDENSGSGDDDWVYGENIIYCRDTFFCCDHRQSAPDAKEKLISWDEEQTRRWQMRKELFPQVSDDTIIFGNFNQLYKIEPTTFRTWLRILARVPKSILWLLRFPDLGESHLLATARQWAGADVASRVIFTDVAPKHLHISRARICDLVLDTAECNAHTTAADVLWSGTPLLTLPRYGYKMCSRMAASILQGALPKNEDGTQAGQELIASSEEDYEDKAVALGKSFTYPPGGEGRGVGRLADLRHMLFHARWESALFDTKRWVRDLEDAYDEAWRRWVEGRGGDIWLDEVPRGRQSIL